MNLNIKDLQYTHKRLDRCHSTLANRKQQRQALKVQGHDGLAQPKLCPVGGHTRQAEEGMS